MGSVKKRGRQEGGGKGGVEKVVSGKRGRKTGRRRKRKGRSRRITDY